MIRIQISKCWLAAISVIFLAAAAGYAQSLDTFKLKAEADSLKARADSLWEACKYDEALPLYQSALADYELVGDKARLALAYRGIGNILYRKWRLPEAISNFESMLALEQEIGNPQGEAEALIAIGDMKIQQSGPVRDIFQRSLRISRKIGDRRIEALSLNGLAYSYIQRIPNQTIDDDTALVIGQKALLLSQQIGDRPVEAKVYFNLGKIYVRKYDQANSLSCSKTCLSIYQEINDLKNQSWVANRIGGGYYYLGDPLQGLKYHQIAYDVSQQLCDSIGLSRSLLYMGQCYESLQEYSKALDSLQRALDYAQCTPSQDFIMTIVGLQEIVYEDLGENDKALGICQRILAYEKERGNYVNIGTNLRSISGIYYRLGNFEQAAETAQEALTYAQKGKDLWGFLYGFQLIAACYYEQGIDSLAIAYYEKAIEMIENERSQLNIQSLKAGYASVQAHPYYGIILAHLRSNHSEQAFDYAERGRARSFLDLLAAGQVRVARPRHREFLANEGLYQQERQKVEELIAAAGDDTAQAAVLRGRLAGDWARTLEQIEETKQEVPELASLVSVNPLTLPEVQNLLDAKTTLLEYFLTSEKILVWVISSDKSETIKIEFSGDSLNTLVMAFRQAIETEDRTDSLSRQLYDLLIAPAAEKIKTEKLVVVPHGMLHYLPFAALQDSQGKYLLDTHRITYLPSASTLKYLEPKRHGRGQSLLALGNPAGGGADYTPLPLAATEVRQIAAMYSYSRVLTGEQATEAAFKTLAPDYDILHLACHGDLNSAYPMNSSLLLAPEGEEDGELQVHEIFSLELSAFLVVLSGCQTGLGRLTTGDDLVGLSRAFIYAGTPSVLSSLWMVEDRSTAYLMSRFYQHLRSHDKAQALRMAQQDTRAKYPELRAWASFVLIGDNE